MAPSDYRTSNGRFQTDPSSPAFHRGIAWVARREWTLWALVLFALLADVVTTVIGVQFGLAEGNPVVATTLAAVGVLGFLAIKVAVVVGAYCCRLAMPRFRLAIPLGVALPWFVATGANVILLFRAI